MGFDDPKTGLVQEPFVAGIDTTIDLLVADVPNAVNGFKALFFETTFPGRLPGSSLNSLLQQRLGNAYRYSLPRLHGKISWSAIGK